MGNWLTIFVVLVVLSLAVVAPVINRNDTGLEFLDCARSESIDTTVEIDFLVDSELDFESATQKIKRYILIHSELVILDKVMILMGFRRKKGRY